MGQNEYQPSIGSGPNIHRMGALSSTQKKNIAQVKLFQDSCKFWGTKVYSNLLPESNFPTTEMFFSEAPVGYHGCWKNKKRE